MKIIDLLRDIRDSLRMEGVPDYAREAEIILSNVLCKDILSLHIDYGESVDESDALKAFDILSRRVIDREPIQYIFGKVPFYNSILNVNPSVLIPRKETELLVERAIEIGKKLSRPKILDIGTGSGAIAISIAKELANAKVTAVDISEDALKVAKANAEENGVNILLKKSDLFSSLRGKFDIIVSNPPYVSEEEYISLSKDVRGHEPKIALVAGDGFDFHRKIIEKSQNFLSEGGTLIMEMGYSQRGGLTSLIEGQYNQYEFVKDYSGNDRFVVASNVGKENEKIKV